MTDEFNMLLEKFPLWKVLRICGWISCFVYNSRNPKEERTKGPLTTEEIERRKLFWIARAQDSAKGSEKFEEDRLQLNLQERQDGLLEFCGRAKEIILFIFPISTAILRRWCPIWSHSMGEWGLH